MVITQKVAKSGREYTRLSEPGLFVDFAELAYPDILPFLSAATFFRFTSGIVHRDYESCSLTRTFDTKTSDTRAVVTLSNARDRERSRAVFILDYWSRRGSLDAEEKPKYYFMSNPTQIPTAFEYIADEIERVLGFRIDKNYLSE